MKTPKVATPKPKFKFNTPKSGLVRKSLGNNSNASLKKLSTKGKEQVLLMVKDNEENVKFNNKTPKKARMSLPADALRNSYSSPENFSDPKTPKKSPKIKEAATPETFKSGKENKANNKSSTRNSSVSKSQNVRITPQNKNISQNVNTPASVENNTSPVKQNLELKKNKVPFNLNDSLVNKTPSGFKHKKGTSPVKAKHNSPEIELGLQLEEALSPKSKKEKKKKMHLGVKVAAQGKVLVNKNGKKYDSPSIISAVDSNNKMKKRRKNRKIIKKVIESKPSFLKHINATNAVNALFKSSKPPKPNLLSGDDSIFLQFSLFKQSKDARGVYKVVLPHSILPESPEVCLVVPDLKGKRNEPDEAIDHYKELLKKNDISSITEIIPLRKLKQEYSQYEERRKLANRFDCIISDGRITHVAQLGKRFARAKKCICPINFNSKTLKEDINRALRKVAIFSSGKGTSFSVKCGRRGMSAGDIADNIVAIGEFLANNKALVDEPLNVSLVAVKTSLSNAFPIYVSTATPNDVKKPKGKQRKIEEPVEDEVTTVQDATVVVYPSGNVKIKKRKNEEEKENANIKQKGNKKNKTNVANKMKVEADSSEDGDSDDMDSLNEDSAIDSLNEMDDDASDDEFEVENGDNNEEEEEEEEEDDNEENDDSISEEEIEAAEKAYLKELRVLQEGIGKKKAKKSRETENISEKKKEDKSLQQNKNAAVKSSSKHEKKGLKNEQKHTKKEVLKEKDANAKGKKVKKQNQVQGSQIRPQKKNQRSPPQWNTQKEESPKQRKKQLKKSPGGKNKN